MIKDTQPTAPIPSGSIPVISPVLHFLSMPVLVCWRHSFGYAFLSPKSVFLATIFAWSLMSYIVWHEPGLKAGYSPLSLFGLVASILYILRLISTFAKQARKQGEHDQDSGTSYLLSFADPARATKLEGFVHGVVEPGLTMVIGFLIAPNPLGRLLLLCGVALAFKELIRAWLAIRQSKRLQDNLGDAKDKMNYAAPERNKPLPSTGRTGRERYERHYDSPAPEAEFAKELRMMPPYSLEKAEANFAELVAGIDPDSPRGAEQILRLNEAIGFFRKQQDSDES